MVGYCLQALESILKRKKVDVNYFNEIGDAPLHTFVRRTVSDKKWYNLLWCFLVHCDRSKFDVNIRNTEEGKTALHLATEVKRQFCAYQFNPIGIVYQPT